jgi:ABC-type transporter Mla MlaB component
MAMQADMLHNKLHAGGVQTDFEHLQRSRRPAIKAAATIRQHHAGYKSAALDRQRSPIRPTSPPPHAGDSTNFGSSVTSASNRLLLPQAASLYSHDLACSADVAQQAQHVDTAELALLQELVQDAQQLQELLERHPEVLQAQHPSPLQAWVSTLMACKCSCTCKCKCTSAEVAHGCCVCKPSSACADVLRAVVAKKTAISKPAAKLNIRAFVVRNGMSILGI